MKRLLITGASRGIGKSIADLIGGRSDIELVTPSRSECDLSDESSVANFLINTQPFDLIVNNAGINIIKQATDILDEEITLLNRVNLESPLKIIRHSVKHMQQNEFGRIVNIGSIWSIRSKECRTLYSGSKFGLAGYTKALAHELGRNNILINTVCPGFIDTELTRASLSVDERNALTKQVPLGRLGRPQEVAEFVEFLLFKNSFITGQSLVIDGGFTA